MAYGKYGGKRMKLINLCEYTVNQSLYDVGVYEDFQTVAERMNAQEFIENLNMSNDIK